MDRQADHILFEKIREGDEKAFEALFSAYYFILCLYATRLTKDATAAEEIVQELFVTLWERRTKINIESSVKNYLYRSVKNRCLNYLKHLKIEEIHNQKIQKEKKSNIDEDFEYHGELLQKIEESIASLPEKRREIFRLSRQEGLKYREISEKLNISMKTVETQIGLAIKMLREKLRDFLPFF